MRARLATLGATLSKTARFTTRPRLAAVLAGALLGFGQSPYDFPPAMLLAGPVLAHLAIAAATPRRAALIGWCAGFGYFALVLSWIVEPFLVDIARHGWMAPFALVGLAGGLALFWAGAFGLAQRLAPAGAARVVMLAVLWAGAEALRGHVLTGFPWALPAYALLETPWLPLAADLGPYALTLLVLTAILLPALGRGGVAASLALTLAALALAHRPVAAPVGASGRTLRGHSSPRCQAAGCLTSRSRLRRKHHRARYPARAYHRRPAARRAFRPDPLVGANRACCPG